MGVIIDMQIWIRTTTSSIYSALSEVISDRQTGTSFGLHSVQRNGLETRECMEPPGLEPPTPHTARERAREAVVYLLPTTPALPGFVVRPQGSCLPPASHYHYHICHLPTPQLPERKPNNNSLCKQQQTSITQCINK